MKIHKANSDYKLEQIEYYQKKTLAELMSIEPRWAYGQEADKILDYSQHPSNKEYSIFYVSPKELIRNSELYEVNLNTLFTGIRLNDSRIAGILERWERSEFVDPPTVNLCTRVKGKLSLSDGRHRTKLAYFLEHQKMPIAIYNSQIEEIKILIQLTAV